jgi:hypothetical protein
MAKRAQVTSNKEGRHVADIKIINQFPKDGFSKADVEAERELRLAIQGVKSSEITDDGDHWTLTTVFPQVGSTAKTVSSAVVKSAAPVSGGPAFGSLVSGGFFSAEPMDLSVTRSIRTNNPGALNFSDWQSSRPGFVGKTQPDGSVNHNVTTIYRTPEHGIASWFHLLSVKYGFGAAGSFSIETLAQRYAGSASGPAVDGYINSWVRLSGGTFNPASVINISNNNALLDLAKAMFHNEAGTRTPVHDDQILFAIQNERAGTLPV